VLLVSSSGKLRDKNDCFMIIMMMMIIIIIQLPLDRVDRVYILQISRSGTDNRPDLQSPIQRYHAKPSRDRGVFKSLSDVHSTCL